MRRTTVTKATSTTWSIEVDGYPTRPVAVTLQSSDDEGPLSGWRISSYGMTLGGLRELGEWAVEMADELIQCNEIVPSKKHRKGRKS